MVATGMVAEASIAGGIKLFTHDVGSADTALITQYHQVEKLFHERGVSTCLARQHRCGAWIDDYDVGFFSGGQIPHMAIDIQHAGIAKGMSIKGLPGRQRLIIELADLIGILERLKGAEARTGANVAGNADANFLLTCLMPVK